MVLKSTLSVFLSAHCLIGLNCFAQEITSGSGINLSINNIRNNKGFIRIGVFRSEEGYPDKPAYGFSLAKDTLKGGRMSIFIPVDKTGYVSLSFLDDENMNGKMDYVFGIMPREGFGFSNNPKITFRRAPPFSATSFFFRGGITGIKIRMVYIY